MLIQRLLNYCHVLNGNYALEAGFSVAKDSIAYEKADSEAARDYNFTKQILR